MNDNEDKKDDIIENENKDNIEEVKEAEIKEAEIGVEEKKLNKPPKVSIKATLSNKRVRYGTYASVMTLAVIAVVVIINLIVGQFGLKFDLTKDKMYSLSDQTKQIVSALDKDINIYAVYATGSENTQFMEMLDKYKALSNRIKITVKDPNINPQFMQKYIKDGETIAQGSLIVESGERFKVLTQYDLVDYQLNQSTYQPQITGIALEPKVTGAIKYVTTDVLPIAYVLEGHNEFELNSVTKQALKDENYEVKTFDILTTGKIPDDTSILIINPPARDYSKNEAEILTDYLSKGGKAIFTLNSADVFTDPTPNYESVLAGYSVKPMGGVIVEANTNNWQFNPLILIPEIQSHEITSPITDSKLRIIIPTSQAIEILDEKGGNTKITPLLTTTKSSYTKTNPESTTAEKEKGDIEGPFNLAVLVEDSWFNDSESFQSKIVVISSTNLLDTQAVELSSGSNTDFFMNCVNFLVDKQDSISIRSKSLQAEYLSLNAVQALTISAIAVIVIPVIILVIAVVIWMRRKNR